MTLQKNFSTQVSDLEALKRIAARAGYTQTRGPDKGEGSIRALLEAMITGEVKIARNSRAKPTRAEAALQRLEAKGLIQRPTRKGSLSPFQPIQAAGDELVSDMLTRERR